MNSEYEKFLLQHPNINDFSNGLMLYIDNDLELFLDSYSHLEKIEHQEETFIHNLFLDDGSFQVKTRISQDRVSVLYKYYPFLNVNNLIELR